MKIFYLYIGYDTTTSAGLGSTAYKQIYCFGDITSYKANDAYSTLISKNLVEIGNPRKRTLKRARTKVLKDKFDI